MGMPVIVPSQTTRCQAISDIIESVALQEAALSHILNAEGEKIQKYTSTQANPTHQELMEVNNSVKDMVKAITNLEMTLYNKLDLFNACLCTDCII